MNLLILIPVVLSSSLFSSLPSMGKTDAQVMLYHLFKTRAESLSWCDPVTHGACTNGATKVFIAKVTREMENACMTQALLVAVPKDSIQGKKNKSLV